MMSVSAVSRNRETSNLMKQIEMMKAAVAREEEKADQLEIKSKSVLITTHR